MNDPTVNLPIQHCTDERCRAPFWMLKNRKTGRSAPIDIEPVPDGPCVIHDDGTYSVLTKADKSRLVHAGAMEMPMPKRYTNHFITCPYADQFHRR